MARPSSWLKYYKDPQQIKGEEVAHTGALSLRLKTISQKKGGSINILKLS
jgi:hypothetical protein